MNTLKKLNLMYIEDDEMIASSTVSYLNRYFGAVAYFNNGKEAYDYLGKNMDIDIILTDITMPKMNGIDLIKAIRSELKIDIPIFALTAHTQEFNAQLRALGVPLICKPVDMDELIGMFESAVQKNNNPKLS